MTTRTQPDTATAHAPARSLELTVYRVPPAGPPRFVGAVDATDTLTRRQRHELFGLVKLAQRRRWDDETLAVAVRDTRNGAEMREQLPVGFGRDGAWRLPDPILRFVEGWRAGGLTS